MDGATGVGDIFGCRSVRADADIEELATYGSRTGVKDGSGEPAQDTAKAGVRRLEPRLLSERN